jgi:hypothetical protein
MLKIFKTTPLQFYRKTLIVIKKSLKHVAFAAFSTSRMCEIIHPSKHLEADDLFVESTVSHPKSSDLFSMKDV